MKVFRYVVCGVVAALSVGCTADMNIADGDIKPPVQGRPTVPLKRRPIVPTSKLPRPRAVELVQCTEGGIKVVLSPEVTVATVVVTELETCVSEAYVVDGGVLELWNIPAGEFEVVVDVDGETMSYRVAE